MLPPEHLAAAHHVCAQLTVTRMLVTARMQQVVALRAGKYIKQIPYLDALLKLAMLIEIAVCTKTATMSLDEIPSLLDLLKQLPAGMQSELEQAIEAERRGDATHETACHDCMRQLLESISARLHSEAEALRQPPQSGHLPAQGQL